MVSVGDNGTEVAELGGYFRYQDVWIITASAVVLGASGSYLLFGPPPTATEGEASTAAAEQSDRTTASAHHDSADRSPTPNPASAPQPAATAESQAVTDGTGNAPAPTPGATTAPDENTSHSEELLEARKREWERTAERLANKEAEVYETLLDADGVLPQSDIVDETDLSKASVSRALDSLETKNLVERKRRGMGNMVLLC